MYRVKEWYKFQHYKDRNPTWIRLYKNLLDDYEFHCLPVASRALAPMLWLLASENKDPSSGIIDASDEKISFRLRMTIKELQTAIKPLINNGFLEVYQIDSDSLSEIYQTATSETETYREESKKDNPSESPLLKKMSWLKIPDHWHAWAMEEKQWDNPTVMDVWEVFREYWQNGKGKSTKREDWTATWRNWCRKEKFETKGKIYDGRNGQKSQLDRAIEATERARAAREQRSANEAG